MQYAKNLSNNLTNLLRKQHEPKPTAPPPPSQSKLAQAIYPQDRSLQVLPFAWAELARGLEHGKPHIMKNLFRYDAKTGDLYWKVSRGPYDRTGNMAGGKTEQGYMRIMIDGKHHYAHRIVWEMFNGKIPLGMQIDHINGNRSDNRIENLRLATQQINSQNLRAAQKNNLSSGVLGVEKLSSGNYRATIVVNWKTIRLGTFKTKEEAGEKYIEAKRQLHLGSTI